MAVKKRITIDESEVVIDSKITEYERIIELKILEYKRRWVLKVLHYELISYYLLIKKDLKIYLTKEKYLYILERLLQMYELHDEIEEMFSTNIADKELNLIIN